MSNDAETPEAPIAETPPQTPEEILMVWQTLALALFEVFALVNNGSWLDYDPAVRKEWAAKMVTFSNGTSRLFTAFNTQVWKGWENGTLSEDDYQGTREARSADAAKPGRKPKEVDLMDKLFAPKK